MTHKHNDIQENIERQTDKVQHKTQDNTEQEIILKNHQKRDWHGVNLGLSNTGASAK